MSTIPELSELAWSDVKCVNTRRGPAIVKSAPPTEQFWNLWRQHKEALKLAGFSVGKFGPDFSVSWWAQGEEFIMPEINDTPEAPVFTMPELPPLQNSTGLLSYQPSLVSNIVYAMQHGNSLNGCGTGIGKTFITLAAARELNLKLLIVCPKTITDDWKEAATKMGVELVGVYGWEWIKTGKTPFLHWNTRRVKKQVGKDWVLVDQKDRMIWNIQDGVAVVFDECHRAANDGTQNSKMVQLAVECNVPIFALSATIADNPTKMRAIGYALRLHQNGKDYFDWMKAHGVTQGRFGYQFQGGARHLLAIHKSIFPKKGIRVRAEQLGDAFPKTQILAKAYNMDESEEISEVYADMMARCAELEVAEMDASSRMANILVEILRARQRVELLKVPLMVQLSKDYMEEGNSIVLAVNFRETLQELIKRLSIESVVMGGQKPEHRRDMIAKFQANETNVLAGIIKACREGLNLHDIHGGHPRVSLIQPTPSAFDLRQVLGRVWRAGGKTPSIQRILFAKDTVEEDICRSLATKLDSLDLLMDGDLQRGVFPTTYSTMRPQTETESEEL